MIPNDYIDWMADRSARPAHADLPRRSAARHIGIFGAKGR